jgi:hypothetical protein
MTTSMRATTAPERPSLLRERFEKIGVGVFIRATPLRCVLGLSSGR